MEKQRNSYYFNYNHEITKEMIAQITYESPQTTIQCSKYRNLLSNLVKLKLFIVTTQIIQYNKNFHEYTSTTIFITNMNKAYITFLLQFHKFSGKDDPHGKIFQKKLF
jgi:hypothetical protein